MRLHTNALNANHHLLFFDLENSPTFAFFSAGNHFNGRTFFDLKFHHFDAPLALLPRFILLRIRVRIANARFESPASSWLRMYLSRPPVCSIARIVLAATRKVTNSPRVRLKIR